MCSCKLNTLHVYGLPLALYKSERRRLNYSLYNANLIQVANLQSCFVISYALVVNDCSILSVLYMVGTSDSCRTLSLAYGCLN